GDAGIRAGLDAQGLRGGDGAVEQERVARREVRDQRHALRTAVHAGEQHGRERVVESGVDDCERAERRSVVGDERLRVAAAVGELDEPGGRLREDGAGRLLERVRVGGREALDRVDGDGAIFQDGVALRVNPRPEEREGLPGLRLEVQQRREAGHLVQLERVVEEVRALHQERVLAGDLDLLRRLAQDTLDHRPLAVEQRKTRGHVAGAGHTPPSLTSRLSWSVTSVSLGPGAYEPTPSESWKNRAPLSTVTVA